MTITYLDLFSGAGGGACGLEMAGLKHAGSYDINESACKTAGANLGKAVFCVDLRKFKVSVMRDIKEKKILAIV
jgi:site-specific DNA-cytosine methylase